MKTLAISLGTRISGVVIIEGRELIVKEMLHMNRTSHSHNKRLMHYLKQYKVEAVIIKLPPETHITKLMQEITERLAAQCKAAHCKVHYTTDKKIKHLSTALVNKYAIIDLATELFPDLLPERQKEHSNKTKYYVKLFEAVLAAHQYQLSQHTSQ